MKATLSDAKDTAVPPTDTPVTVSGLTKYVPLLVSGAVALAVSAFGWGVTYATLTSDVMTLTRRVDKIEASATDVTALTHRMGELEEDATRPDLEARLARIEALVGQLVCLDDRADKELCRQALSGGRQ